MQLDIHQDRILILDFGSQYTQLIARRVRELGVYCELHPYDMHEAAIVAFAPKGIILSGGPETVTAQAAPRVADAVFALGCPVLGICYGLQALAAQHGGQVVTAAKREFGYAQVRTCATSALFADVADSVDAEGTCYLDVWMSHADKVHTLPPGFVAIAATDNAPFAAIADVTRHYYGVQFHPEVTHTRQGLRLLENFVKGICGCAGLWTPRHIIDDSIALVRQQVGTDKVILGLSGGVDSSVVACLLQQALGEQLVCVFVDNGLLRAQEAEQVIQVFTEHFKLNLLYVDAKARFLAALVGQTDPEQKRKIIGKLFIDVFAEQAQQLGGVAWLAQGTIYPDVIESAASHTGKAKVIKSHHNVGGLPERMHLKLIEPLRELFKDEVRQLGLALGLPPAMVYRHPFPGPGLAVRVLGEVKAEYLVPLAHADAIFIEELRKHDLYDEVSQAFAVFLPVKSVAVMGDARCYDYVIALRAVQTVDFMTAQWAHLPHEFLQHVSSRIINEVSGVSRVVYDISGKPPATIEWE